MPVGCVIHGCISEAHSSAEAIAFHRYLFIFCLLYKTSSTAERVMLNELGIPEKNLNIKCDTLKKRNKNKPIFHIS
jgi:hypothetical protein